MQSQAVRCVALLTVGLACILLTASCGASDNGVTSKPASQILVATMTAAQSASSVRIVARSSAGGANATLDASLAKDRGRAHVSVFGVNFEAIRDGDTLYVKGNDAFDASLERTLGMRVPSGTWLKGSTNSLAQIGSFTNLNQEVPVILSGTGPVTKGARVKINGQPAITLKEERKLYTGTLYVATTGQPYPLKLIKTGRETGQTTFSGWNDPVNVTPPSNAVDISHLQHGKER